MLPTIVHTADWHLGHSRVPSADTAHDIRQTLFPQLKPDVILIIAGDILDGKISMNSTDAECIISLFVDLFHICYGNDIIIRIMRGTYSHDQRQLQFILRLFKKLNLPVDYKIIDTITLERIDRYNLDLVYMPDNLPYKTKHEALDFVKMIMTVNDVNLCDYVIFHGEFDHMSFGPMNHNAYSSEDFSSICKHLILAGHVHKPHQYKNIVYSGSFNRLAHNEEEAKGFWLINGDQATFIENVDATKFFTIDYSTATDLEAILTDYKERMKLCGTERQAFVRVIITDTHMKQALISYHNAHFPNIKLTFKSNNLQSSNTFLNDKLKRKQITFLEIPSLKNVSTIVCNHLMSKNIELSVPIIESIINGG